MRGFARFAVALALSGSACQRATPTPSAVPEPPGAWPSAPDEGYALLPWGTKVYVEPRYGARAASLGSPNHRPRPWPSHGMVVEVMGSRDGFVEIRPLLRRTVEHCTQPLDGEQFDVRLYVSPWSFASVLTEPFEVSFDDGTMIALWPGAAVRPIEGDPERRWAVSAAGVDLRVPLTADLVGRSYREPKPQTLPSDRRWELGSGRDLAYDGGWPLALHDASNVVIESVLPLDGRFRVEVVSRCARVVTMAPTSPAEAPLREFHHFDFGLAHGAARLPAGAALEPEALLEEAAQIEQLGRRLGFSPDELSPVDFEDVVAGELRLPEEVTELIFETGAPIYLTAAGPPAGTLTELRVFRNEFTVAGERLCFRTSFGARFWPRLHVCFDAAEARVRSPQTDPHDFGPGEVEPGDLRVSAGLDQARVARALRLHRHDLRHCYGQALRRTPKLQGTLELTLDVDAHGVVTDARLRSPWMKLVSECATRVARTWHIPPAADGTPSRVTFSVELSDGSTDPGG